MTGEWSVIDILQLWWNMKLCYSATHNGNVFMIKAKSVDYLTLVGTNCNRANAQVNGIGELI